MGLGEGFEVMDQVGVLPTRVNDALGRIGPQKGGLER